MKRVAAAVAVSALVLAARSAGAAATEADRALARELAIAGITQADQGDCAGAVEKLDRAAQLYPAPTILGRLGECRVALGQVVAGTEILQRVVREELPRGASPAFVKAQERARGVLEAALPKIARLAVHVVAPQGVSAEVALDGVPIPPASLDEPRPVDPGAHEVTARADGYALARGRVTLAPAQRSAVTLTLTPDTAPIAAASPLIVAPIDATPKRPPAPVDAPPQTRPAWQIVVPWAATGALAAGAAVTGVLALGASSDLKSQLASFPVTQSQLTATESRGARFALAADVLTGSAVAMGAVAVYFTWTRRAAPVRVSMGPASIAVVGSW